MKTKMGGFRAIYFDGANRLRIRNNKPFDKRQWFVFDSRTRTIRSSMRRNYVMSNQAGYGYRIGGWAMMRVWRGQIDQRISFWGGSYSNIRNNGGKCLDVWGGRNNNNQKITFWNCHRGQNQRWFLSRDRPRQQKPPRVIS
jgi:hypothetical protein